jgi:predicted nucleotidyltransferase/DNA-binding Xre family transcriptional regulator
MGMEHATRVGARIRACRLARGLSASALAVRAGVTENAIRKIESGDSKEPRFSTGVRIATALGVDPSDLVDVKRAPAGTQPDLASALRAIRKHQQGLRDLGVAHLAIFGSVARGEANASSDIDLIIEPAPNARFTLLDLAACKHQLERLLGNRVDVVTRRTLRQSHAGRAAEEEAVRVS